MSIEKKRSLTQRVIRRALGAKRYTQMTGDFRQREALRLVVRPNYAYGLLRAADTAKFFGFGGVTVCEFGVATGRGLLNMAEVAAQVTEATGVTFRIVGFDTGAGLLPPAGAKDHPELWSSGDFAMEDPAALRQRIGGRAELILGDIADTIAPFVESIRTDHPLGFVAIDVDVYTATVSALKGLGGNAEKYLPALSFYFDDIAFYFANVACGELAAIAEHNLAMPNRPLDRDRSLPGFRHDAYAPWYGAMYVAHVLDHPLRMAPRERKSLSLDDHLRFVGALH